MARVIRLADRYESHRKYAEEMQESLKGLQDHESPTAQVIPLEQEGVKPAAEAQRTVTLIENADATGVLISENFQVYVGGVNPYLYGVDYLRRSEGEVIKRYFSDIRFIAREGLYLPEADGKKVLPALSSRPYIVCEIREGEYDALQVLLRSSKKKCLEHTLSLISEAAGFPKKFGGKLFWKRTSLQAPTGYADLFWDWTQRGDKFDFEKGESF